MYTQIFDMSQGNPPSIVSPRVVKDDSVLSFKLSALKLRYAAWRRDGGESQVHWYSARDLAAFARDSALFSEEISQVLQDFSQL